MNISFNLLKQFISFGDDTSPDDITRLLVEHGIETGPVVSTKGMFTNIVTAEIRTIEKHPNADKLSLCTVFDGTETHSIVCGASNIFVGAKAPLAKIGAHLPGGLTIAKTKIRGTESFGMLCSEKELGLSADAKGISILPPDTPLGVDAEKIFGLDDSTFEIEITPNRGDCLSMLGIAREVGGILGKPVTLPTSPTPTCHCESSVGRIEVFPKSDNTPRNDQQYLTVRIETNACTRYIAHCIQLSPGFVGRIEVFPKSDNTSVVEPTTSTPLWMKNYLRKAGMRSINPIVDITNYVLWEMGHPMHAFDYDTLQGKTIIVRNAREGETIVTLDGQTRTLCVRDVVIADASRPIALAGIMGGENTGVTATTKNIVFESAYFNPVAIRTTAKRLGISSDSSYRFERGVCWNGVERACARAYALTHEIIPSAVSTHHSDSITKPYIPTTISVRPTRVAKILGQHYDDTRITTCLENIGFSVGIVPHCTQGGTEGKRLPSCTQGGIQGGSKTSIPRSAPSSTSVSTAPLLHCSSPAPHQVGDFTVTVPSFRNDIFGEIDVIEEIARVDGYTHIPTHSMRLTPTMHDTPLRAIETALRTFFRGKGLCEAKNYSFASKKLLDRFDEHGVYWELKNPLSEDEMFMVTSRLPRLVANAAENLRRTSSRTIQLFEIGKCFSKQTFDPLLLQHNEIRTIAGVVCGDERDANWHDKSRPIDFYYVSGLLHICLSIPGLGIAHTFVPTKKSFLDPPACAAIVAHDGTILGVVGKLSKSCTKTFDLPNDVYVWELTIENFPHLHTHLAPYKKPSQYPVVERDLSLVMNATTPAATVLSEITTLAGELLKDITIFDVYEGAPIEQGCKNIAVRLYFQASDRTLSDDEVNAIQTNIINGLSQKSIHLRA